jgi:DNA-binding response OmpR family regulator
MTTQPRVLIVDDEEELVSALTERLNMRGFDTNGVTTGAAALDAIERGEYDVVLLDLKMPDLDGLQVIQRIKEKHPRLQVIMLTGHGSTQAAQEGMNLGAYDYLVKPIRIEDLVRVVLAASSAAGEED